MKIDLQPHLKGELIELKALQPADFEPLFAVASDPLVWEQHPQKNRYQREIFQKFFQAALDSKSAFTAYDLKTGRAIGSSRYCEYDSAKRQISVGYTFLSRDCWGHTFNREMKKLMLDYIFQSVDSVLFYIGAENTRSRKAVEKIGAQFVAEQQGKAIAGLVFPEVIYQIKKDDWISTAVPWTIL